MIPVSEKQQSIKCPFCEKGYILPKVGHTGCPKCYVRVRLDDRMECIFVDKSTFRLPIHGTVCPSCGLVQSEHNQECCYCGTILNSTSH